MSKNYMIYGATGYTGELIARRAAAQGEKPIIAGRNAAKIEALGAELGFETRVFDLGEPNSVAGHLDGLAAVLHCAGPFVNTAQPMAEACIERGIHYLDITGEIPVYELLQGMDQKAQQAGTMLLPGVGFDIVPTDCLAAKLKSKMKDAVDLKLAFVGLGSVSAGTTKSALAQMPYGSKVRRNGSLVTIDQFSQKLEKSFGGKTYTLYAIPWGDVFTAYYSTGIPNIEVYAFIPGGAARMAPLMKPFMGLLKNKTILSGVQGVAGLLLDGPDENTRQTGKTYVWGQVTDERGTTLEGELHTIEGYELTIISALAAVRKVVAGDIKPGFQTPSAVFGADFVLEVPGCKWVGV